MKIYPYPESAKGNRTKSGSLQTTVPLIALSTMHYTARDLCMRHTPALRSFRYG